MKDLNDMLKQMTVFEYRMDQWKKPSLLEKMSKWDQTERICLEAVRENSHALKYVSKRIVNYEICKEAVMNNGLALMYVPQEFRTIELCEMAVMRNGEAVLFVPEELLSNEICERAVRRNPRAIAHIPNKYKSSALCFDTVKRVPELIRTVPNQKKSTALCHAAVEQDGLLLEHVPEKKKTKELCKLAVEQNPNALEYVPQELKDRELCEHAMQANIEAIRYVPFEFVNEEWADTAIQNSWELALYIPDELYTIDRCSIILDKMLDDIKPSEIEDWYDYNDELSADDEISQKDCLEYYFDRMVFYSLAIKNMLSKYHDALKKVSNYVRKIGGSGTVHGSIVDIDFWNHIYINPLDGTITPYHAESMMEKYVYKSFENLLSKQCPRLYENYERLRLEEKHSIGVLKRKIDVGADEINEFVSDTYMYKPSRVLRSLQYIVDASVIRVWNDELIDSMVEKYGLSAPQILG